MNRLIKKITVIVVLAYLLTSTGLNAVAVVDLPRYIRVGLFYSVTAQPFFTAAAEGGLQFGYGDGFTPICEWDSSAPVLIRKDACFTRSNGTLKEWNPSSKAPQEGLLLGPYHIAVAGAYANWETARIQAESMRADGLDAYPAYNGTWQVWIGSFCDEVTAKVYIIADLDFLFGPGVCSLVKPSEKSVVVESEAGEILFIYDDPSGAKPLRMKAKAGSDPEVLVLNSKDKYRGSFEVLRQPGSDMTLVNVLPLEEYLYGNVPPEIGANAHAEALKAQAIVSRTYAINNIGKHSHYGFDLCSTVDCQVYKGYNAESAKANKAVDDTCGKVVVYNGGIAQVYYFASSGGRTENSENVWSVSLPYLRSVPDPYESDSIPNYLWNIALTPSKIRETLKSRGSDIGSIVDVEVTKTTESGRVLELVVIGSRGKSVYEREKTRTVFGLRSQLYSITTDADVCVLGASGAAEKTRLANKYVMSADGVKKIENNVKTVQLKGENGQIKPVPVVASEYRFIGKGWGHGVGMSQEGAKGMAQAGFTYEEIIKHYFTGVEIYG